MANCYAFPCFVRIVTLYMYVNDTEQIIICQKDCTNFYYWLVLFMWHIVIIPNLETSGKVVKVICNGDNLRVVCNNYVSEI